MPDPVDLAKTRDSNHSPNHLRSMPNGESLPGAPTNFTPSAIAQVGEWSTTSWVEGDKLYLVASLGDAGHVKHSLGI